MGLDKRMSNTSARAYDSTKLRCSHERQWLDQPMGPNNRMMDCQKKTDLRVARNSRGGRSFDIAGFSRTAITMYGETLNMASPRSAQAEPCGGIGGRRGRFLDDGGVEQWCKPSWNQSQMFHVWAPGWREEARSIWQDRSPKPPVLTPNRAIPVAEPPED